MSVDNFQQGDLVFSLTHGHCKVKSLGGWPEYPVRTEEEAYTQGGKRFINDTYPSLFHAEAVTVAGDMICIDLSYQHRRMPELVHCTCGGEPEILDSPQFEDTFTVRCDRCGRSTGYVQADTPDDAQYNARHRWNSVQHLLNLEEQNAVK